VTFEQLINMPAAELRALGIETVDHLTQDDLADLDELEAGELRETARPEEAS
jgi:hypothetical protein